MTKYIVLKGTPVRLYKSREEGLFLIDDEFITEQPCFFDDDDCCKSYKWIFNVLAFNLPKNNRNVNIMVVNKNQVEIYD